ncbi:MAG: ATP-dependent RNA helicase HrpA [Methylophilaceae bacterium]
MTKQIVIKDIDYPSDLPVSQRVDDIKKIILAHQVTIICGETGSGKTTQLPKICLDVGLGKQKMIGHTQPRRIAARSVAGRIAEELNTPVGEIVGYKIRFMDRVTKTTSIKVMTDGILLAETQNDPMLSQYDAIIIDEAHERSLNIDFLLGYLSNLLRKRRDLKIIITSATIDVDKFSQHFDDAPIIKVSGRTFPVDIVYSPLQKINEDSNESIEDAILRTIDELVGNSGDILVFLPGERDIHDCKKFLSEKLIGKFEVLPLFSRLPINEQQKIFKPGGIRRVILATNIAETSLTVPRIKFVIDAGFARVVRYSPKLKIEQLLIEKISKASANQRSGRCGRIAPGICIRLFDEEDFKARPEFTDPEILRSSLASVILKMAALKLGPVDEFPFIQSPSYRFIQDGYHLLQELGAVDMENKILPLGIQLSKLPIDPSLGRILLESKKENCVQEALIIISALSVSDPRERPIDKAEQADKAHQFFHDPDSGFNIFLKLWKQFSIETKKVTNKSLRQFTQKYFLSFNRIKEWHELHRQLKQIADELKFNISATEATYEQTHRALLSGLLGNIGFKDIDGQMYSGGRSIKFLIGPRLFRNKNFKWIMAAEIIDTGRLYAQCVARIDVRWIESLAIHLLEYEYSNPRWNTKLSRVDATEKSLLYGLVVNPGKTVHFGGIDPDQSRKIFIRQGLVEQGYESNGLFWKHNLKLIQEIEMLEHKTRRQDILINDDVLYQFYDERIDEKIVNGAGFEGWRKEKEKNNSEYLFLTKTFLMQREALQVDEIQYPEKKSLQHLELHFRYHFQPGHPRDGLSVEIPLSGISQIKSEDLAWLVPGMIREKVTFLIKNLPKNLRGQCGHLQEAVTEFLTGANNEEEFSEVFTKFIRQKTNSKFRLTEKSLKNLPEHLMVNYVIVDESNIPLDEGRDLLLLQKKNKDKVVEVLEDISFGIEQMEIKYWPKLKTIPDKVEKKINNTVIVGYPALVDKESHVDLFVADDKAEADYLHQEGIKRLIKIQLQEKIKYIKKNPPRFEEFGMLLHSHISPEDLKKNFIDVVFNEIVDSEASNIKSQNAFDTLTVNSRKSFSDLSHDLSSALTEIAKNYSAYQKAKANIKYLPKTTLEDLSEQLDILLPPYERPLFLFDQLKHIPRYLNAMTIRLKKFSMKEDQDQVHMREINRLRDKWIEKVVEYVEAGEAVPENFIDFQWALQELRVSLFAQELKTSYPISIKRMDKRWMKLVD